MRARTHTHTHYFPSGILVETYSDEIANRTDDVKLFCQPTMKQEMSSFMLPISTLAKKHGQDNKHDDIVHS